MNFRGNKQFQAKHLSVRIEPENVQFGNDLPDYELSEISSIRERLNEAKSQLDIYWTEAKRNPSAEKKWFAFQYIIDLYKPMRGEIEKKFNASIVTNAWMKYWEIYSQYELITKRDHTFNAFFNAELPGAALCAYNHYMKTMRPGIQFNWRASSLLADTSDALGDNYGLYAHNKNKWLMNEHNNGDSTVLDNLLDFVAQLSPLGGIDLYSHDAGIDVSEDFNNQELANAKIHLGCALAGFMTLRIGGNFIAKQYTFLETFTWNLIIIYAQMFSEFYICKPLTSRPYNSEIYLVGKGFRGMSDDIRDLLVERLQNFNTSPFIPRDAIKEKHQLSSYAIQKFAQVVFGQQISFINENVQLFEKYKANFNVLRNAFEELIRSRIREWLKTYPVRVIANKDQLPSNYVRRDH